MAQVIITTHAMEEAEALCSRIGIMIQVGVAVLMPAFEMALVVTFGGAG